MILASHRFRRRRGAVEDDEVVAASGDGGGVVARLDGQFDVLDRRKRAGQRAGQIGDQQDARRDRRSIAASPGNRRACCRPARASALLEAQRSARQIRGAASQRSDSVPPFASSDTSARPISSPSPSSTTGAVIGSRTEVDDRA